MQPLLWESTTSTATSHRSSQQSSKSRLLREDDFVGNEKLQETVRERQGDSLWYGDGIDIGSWPLVHSTDTDHDTPGEH